jgi:hypothetical protein
MFITVRTHASSACVCGYPFPLLCPCPNPCPCPCILGEDGDTGDEIDRERDGVEVGAARKMCVALEKIGLV